MILIIDNYDSFTYNLYQYIGEIYKDIRVCRNDEISLKEIENMKPEGVVISPGPGIPEDSGVCVEFIKKFRGEIPILGICLGHQAIASAYGGKIKRAPIIKHGKCSLIKHEKNKLFSGVKEYFNVMRYHSLIIDENNLPKDLIVTAKSLDDGVIMAVEHEEYKVYGVQFHPESLVTEFGKTIIKNFLEGICNVTTSSKESNK